MSEVTLEEALAWAEKSISPEVKALAAEVARLRGAPKWQCPNNTVGALIESLRTIDPATSIHTAYFIELDGKKITRVTSPSLSYETVKEGKVSKYCRDDRAVVIWASHFPDPATGPREPQSALAQAAGMGFCCATAEKLTLENADLRNVVQAGFNSGDAAVRKAWEKHFPRVPA
jgi:hypothetical protein